MPILERLRDAFVTTDHEHNQIRAQSTQIAAENHLKAIVPAWHQMRTEALVDQHSVRPVIDEIETRLAPLEKDEAAARDLYECAANAISSLNGAIEALENARTYETVDLMTSNTFLSAASTISNSEAAERVQEAHTAIEQLSAKTKTSIEQGLLAPTDTLDLIFDLTMGDMFDFMSIFSLGKINDACDRCESARKPVQDIEQRLAAAYSEAQDAATTVRNERTIAKKPYREMAFRELPAQARPYALLDVTKPLEGA